MVKPEARRVVRSLDMTSEPGASCLSLIPDYVLAAVEIGGLSMGT